MELLSFCRVITERFETEVIALIHYIYSSYQGWQKAGFFLFLPAKWHKPVFLCLCQFMPAETGSNWQKLAITVQQRGYKCLKLFFLYSFYSIQYCTVVM